MNYQLGKSESFFNLLENLYSNNIFINNLNEIKKRMRVAHNYTMPQFDDIEAEIVCLILMHLNPKKICEFSPCGGWSTLYMLNTLDVMKNTECKIDSYDIIDNCTSNINNFSNLKNQWELHLGNVESKYISFNEDIDYLFIDSDHSSTFTKKYIDELLNPLLIKLKNMNKKIFVSVHDVFHSNIPSDEGMLVIEFLHKNNIEYFSPLNDYHRNNLQKIRYNTNLDKKLVHDYTTNPCIFFLLG
jgi:predicted O-methyltransferase YrrM